MRSSPFQARASPHDAGPLRVLVVTPFSLETNPYLNLLIAAMEAEGADVRIAVGRSPFLFWRAIRRDGLPQLVHLQWQHRYFTSASLPGAVLRSGLFFLQWFVLRLLGVRFVWTVHNILDHERRQAAWEIFICRRWARRVDAIIVLCSAAVPLVADAYGISADRISVAGHGPVPEGRPQPSRTMARRSLELPAAGRVLLFFGRVRAYKGLETLLDAFSQLRRPDAHLVLLGHPDSEELGQALAARAAEDPRITTRFEFVSDEMLDAYLAAADLVVLPYRDLLTSGAAYLAASRERAVLAPHLGCLSGLPPETAILYPPDRLAGLDEALGRALDAPLEEMGRAARRHVEAYPWSRAAADTLRVYREAAS